MLTVTAAIISRNNKYLITRRRQQDSMGGYWEFPGGGVDEGETPDQCIRREIIEELGVLSKPISLFDSAVVADGQAVILFYFCDIEGEPSPLDCDEMCWVAADELRYYKLLPADIIVADKLGKLSR